VSFEDTFEDEARQTFGDLGPQGTPAPARSDDSGGGGPRRNRERGPRRSGPRR
jgi:hypothetical protein